MKIFSGSANNPLAEKVARELHIPLSPLERFIFPDGEQRIWIEEDVVDIDTVVVQPTSTPVDANYMELCFIIDGLKRSGARSVTVVMPYVGYQRQDHVFRSGEAVSLNVVIRMIEDSGADRVIAYDLHSIKIQEVFCVPITHLSALSLFAKTIREQNWTHEDTMLISPDMGGIRRIKMLSDELERMPYAMVVKNRDLATGNIEASDIVDGNEHHIENVRGRALIVDDMASSGKTLVEAAKKLRAAGAEEVYAFVTHAIFSQDAPKLLQDSLIKKVFVTDTVFVPDEKQFEKLQIISISEEIAQSLKEK